MAEISALTASNDDDVENDSTCSAVREWASTPATRGFALGAASVVVAVALALALACTDRRPSI